MKSSVIAVLSGAAVAFAGPVALGKRVYEVEWQTVYTTATVTAGQQPTQAPVAPVIVAPPPVAEVVTITKGPEVQPIVPAPTPKQEDAPAPQPTYAAPPKPPTDGSMADTAMYHHNAHRSNHSAPAMTWNSDIANAAQMTANTCVFAHQTGLNGLNYGQNIAAFGTDGDIKALGTDGAIAKAISDMWYNELPSYMPYFGKNPDMSNFNSWGHISQLLWKDSTELGCAVTLCPGKTVVGDDPAYFMVCNYYPAGNMGGAYATNVLPPLGEAPVSA